MFQETAPTRCWFYELRAIVVLPVLMIPIGCEPTTVNPVSKVDQVSIDRDEVTHIREMERADVEVLPSQLGLDGVLGNADVAIAKAVREASTAVEESPKSAAAWGKLAMLLSAHDMKEIAARCFRRAAELDPNDTRWPYLRGRALRHIDPDASISALETAVEVNQEKIANPRLQLAEVLLEQGRVDEAAKQIQISLGHHKRSDRARLLMARAEFLRGNWRACLTSLEQFTGEPNKKVFVLRAEAHRRLGNNDEADRLRALADTTESYGWGDLYIQEERSLRTGLKVSLNEADMLFGARKFQKSIEILEELIQAYPESDWAKVLLGRAYIRTKRYTDAEQQLRAALELAPGSVEALYRLGVTLFRQGRLDEASEQFRKAVRLKPDFTMAYFNLSFCQQENNDLMGATKSMRRCVQCEPAYLDGWHRLALLESESGDKARSRKAYERALALDPNNATIREQLRLLDIDTSVDLSDLDL